MGLKLQVVLTLTKIYQMFIDQTDVSEVEVSMIKKAEPAIITKVAIHEGVDTLVNTSSKFNLTDGSSFVKLQVDTVYADVSKEIGHAPVIYKDKKLSTSVFWIFVGLVFFQILLVTMVYGPIAAFLVELFPTKIRYTSMSLPYHVGNGVFGGLVPFIATLIASFAGSTPLSGLWYPIGIAALSFVIGAVYLTNKTNENTND